MKFDCSSIVGHGIAFGNEGRAHGWFCELIKLVMGKSGQDTALSDSTVTDCDGLDLENGLLCGHKIVLSVKSIQYYNYQTFL